METFLPPSKRWQELLEIAKVACGRIKSPFNHKRQNSLKRLKLCTLGKMQVDVYSKPENWTCKKIWYHMVIWPSKSIQKPGYVHMIDLFDCFAKHQRHHSWQPDSHQCPHSRWQGQDLWGDVTAAEHIRRRAVPVPWGTRELASTILQLY